MIPSRCFQRSTMIQGLLLLLLGVQAVSAFSSLSTCQSSSRLAYAPSKHRQHQKLQLLMTPTQRASCQVGTATTSRVSPLFYSSINNNHRWIHHHHQQHQQQRAQRSLLFQHPESDSSLNTSSNNRSNIRTSIRTWLKHVFNIRAHWQSLLSRVPSKIKRAAVILVASAMIWLGSGHSSMAPPASASTAAAAAATPSSAIERVLPSSSSSKDQIIDRYIKQHMFDEDDSTTADPLESAYREAYEDYETKGTHPRALQEITAEVLGGKAGKNIATKASVDDEGGLGFLGILTSTVRIMEKRGLSESTALAVVAFTLTIAVPSLALIGWLMLGNFSKRSMNRLMKKRYGETYTVDATIKQEEPEVEAPDDEEDDDDDNDDDDDDE